MEGITKLGERVVTLSSLFRLTHYVVRAIDQVSVESTKNMLRIRSLFLWFVVLALPLQGFAATSMLFCGMGGHHANAQAEMVETGAHGIVGVDRQNTSVQHVDTTHLHVKKASEGKGKLSDLTHKCGVCASCCFSVAISSMPRAMDITPSPKADLAEPFVLIHAIPSRVPERPPRA